MANLDTQSMETCSHMTYKELADQLTSTTKDLNTDHRQAKRRRDEATNNSSHSTLTQIVTKIRLVSRLK